MDRMCLCSGRLTNSDGKVSDVVVLEVFLNLEPIESVHISVHNSKAAPKTPVAIC